MLRAPIFQMLRNYLDTILAVAAIIITIIIFGFVKDNDRKDGIICIITAASIAIFSILITVLSDKANAKYCEVPDMYAINSLSTHG